MSEKEQPEPLKKDDLGELTLLYEVSRLLEQSLDLRDVVSPVLEALARHMGMRYATLWAAPRASSATKSRTTESTPRSTLHNCSYW